MSIQWPLDTVNVTGEWANSPWYYQQFGQIGHNGIDLSCSVGTPVYATDSGTVVAEGWGNYDNWMGSIAGIFVRIGHSWGFSAYAHLSTTNVNVGQWVERGQLIGYSGATGVGTGPHLHFETFTLSPNFGNGFAGRVNPRSWGLVPRGSGGSSGGSTAKPTPNAQATIDLQEETEMANQYIGKEEKGKQYNLVFNTVSGFAHEFESADGKYNTKIARTFGVVNPSAMVSVSHYNKLVADLAVLRAARK